MKMPFAKAQALAEKILEWIKPYAERVIVAGSVRRSRPVCNDIDLVIIPLRTHTTDLLGTVISSSNHLHQFLVNYVNESQLRSKWLKGEQNPDGDNYILQLPKCQLDIFTASPENFATRLLCRTGSMQHNIWLAERARQLGGKWCSYEGVRLDGSIVPATTEEEVYAALDLPWIDPRDREVDYLERRFGTGEKIIPAWFDIGGQ